MKERKPFWNRYTDSYRKLRTELFTPLGSYLVQKKISANMVTYVSLVFGVLAAFFLFKSFWFFFLFALLHFLADGLDGVIARIRGTTEFGKYFDYITDRIVTLLLLLKVWVYLDQWFVLIAIGLFLTVQTIHIVTKFEYPVLFTRSLLLLVLFLGLPTLAYWITGGASFYSLIAQGIYFVKKKKEKKKKMWRIRKKWVS